MVTGFKPTEIGDIGDWNQLGDVIGVKHNYMAYALIHRKELQRKK